MSTAKYPVGGSVKIGHGAQEAEVRRGRGDKTYYNFSSPLLPTLRKEKISKFNPRRVLVAKKLGYATRSHQFTRLQTIPSIVTLFKTFSFLLGDG